MSKNHNKTNVHDSEMNLYANTIVKTNTTHFQKMPQYKKITVTTKDLWC